MSGVVGPSRNRVVSGAFDLMRKEERNAKRIHNVLSKPEPTEAPKKTTKPRKAAKRKDAK